MRTVSEYLGNIYRAGEQRREATIRNFRIARLGGAREVACAVEHYNLDPIIAGFTPSRKVLAQRGKTQVPSVLASDSRVIRLPNLKPSKR